ncbi:MAG: tetratricopeptide repeat protein [Rhodobacteraceae bacterium]|nr:tetratricopeptide repeat protein [Paracoccaceae bacterium]
MQETGPQTFQFGDFVLDKRRFELRHHDEILPVEPQTLGLIIYLVEHRGRVVSRDELQTAIWGGRVISDWAISAAIKSARQALQDTGRTKRIIRTIHGRGFRFIAPVSRSTPVTGRTLAQKTLLVLPFRNLSGEASQDYLALGMTDDLITDLSQLSSLTVASRHVSARVSPGGTVPDDLATALKLSHFLEGSVRRHDDDLRVNVQLVDARTGVQVWANRFESSGGNFFSIQNKISAETVKALNLHLAPNPSLRGTADPHAYDLCLRGRAVYFQYSPPAMAQALEFFEAATEKDPGFAEAYAYQSYCRTALHVFNRPGSDSTLNPAIKLAEKAIALNDRSALAHTRLGWALGYVNQPERAVASFETALACEPGNAEAYQAYGETLNRLGQPQAGLQQLEQAFALEQFAPPSWDFCKGHSLVLLQRWNEAIDCLQDVVDRVPQFIPAQVQLARLYAETGEITKARETVANIAHYAPNYRLDNAQRMFPYPQQAERKRLQNALLAAGMNSQ